MTTQQQSKHHSDKSPMLPRQRVAPSPTPVVQQTFVPQPVAPAYAVAESAGPKEPDYIRVGDIVRIEFDEQIFDGLKEYEELDEGRDNPRLAKILEKPDFEYGGVVYSDGVVDKEFRVIPKDIKVCSDRNFTEQKKSVFRVEVVQDCRFAKQYNELRTEMLTADFAEEENPEEEAEKRAIYEEVRLKYQKELKANLSEQQLNSGNRLLYGQTVQFRQISSGLFLTLNTKRLSSEYGCFELSLSYCSEYCRFRLLPPEEKTKEFNQPIEYDDSFLVKSSVESAHYYLHCDSSDLHGASNSERGKMVLTVNANNSDSNATKWKACKYLSYETLPKNESAINSMDTIRLFHREIGGYLTVTRREIESDLPEYPDFLKKEIAILAEEKDGLDEDEDEIVIEEGRVEQEILIYIERDINKLDYTNSLWEIQKADELIGGVILTNEKYLIRHVGTGMYLCISEHFELNLTTSGSSEENEFSFQDETCQDFIKSVIEDKSIICMKNFDGKYIQTYFDMIKDEFSYIKSRSASTEVPIV